MSSGAVPPLPQYANRRVLVIDDSQMVLKVASSALTAAGFEVRTVLYPQSVRGTLMQEVVEFDPALILSDVEMPLVTGDVFARVAKSSPTTSRTLLYFYSSRPEGQLRQHVRDSGADGYIPKSPNVSDLVARVMRILR